MGENLNYLDLNIFLEESEREREREREFVCVIQRGKEKGRGRVLRPSGYMCVIKCRITFGLLPEYANKP